MKRLSVITITNAVYAAIPEPGTLWLVALGLVALRLRPGYSGGPLVDDRGRLVGLNTMMVGPDVGVAVPVQVVKKFLREQLGSAEWVSETGYLAGPD